MGRHRMKNKKDATQIWKDYEKGISYKSSKEIFDTIRLNQEFYNGEQWKDVNAPTIEKPVLNIIRQAVDYYVSMIVSDDIAVMCDLKEDEDEQVRKALEYVTSDGIGKVFETTKFKEKTRYFVKNCAIDGDAYFHWWYNTNKNLDSQYKGAIDLELVDSTNVIFGNPAEQEEQKQPYILVIQKLPVNEVKELVMDKLGDGYVSMVEADAQHYTDAETDASSVENYTTVITRFWKENNEIWWSRSIKQLMIEEPTNLEIRLYPIAKMGWKKEKNSYHSISPITEARPNQIMINKMMMMLNEITKRTAFFKVFYDKNVIKQMNNKTEAIGVNGGINGDIRGSITTVSPNISGVANALSQYLDSLIDKTKASMGIYDVALGNVKPENTSAIIALQKTASQPLELQRLDYLQVVENSVRIIIDLMSTHYGKRNVPIQVDATFTDFEFDFSDLDFNEFGMNVEVGQASYWSEITQIQTTDALFQNQIIDAKTYVEIQPNGIIPKKNIVLANIAAKQAFLEQQAQMTMPQGMPQGNNLPIQ